MCGTKHDKRLTAVCRFDMSTDRVLGVFIRDGVILTSPTRSFLPPEGIPTGNPELRSTRIKNIATRGWVCDDVLEAGFYPIQPHYAGTILAPLGYSSNKGPLEEDGKGGYRDPRWQQIQHLQLLFSDMITAFQRFLKHSPYAELSMRVADVAGPERYPYHHFLKQAEARAAASKARLALTHQVAKLAFFVELCNEVKSDASGWYQVLSDAGVHRADLDSVKASYIVNSQWNSPRAGFFVRPDWRLRRYLPFFIHSNIPLYICWGSPEAPVQPPPDFPADQRLTRAMIARTPDMSAHRLGPDTKKRKNGLFNFSAPVDVGSAGSSSGALPFESSSAWPALSSTQTAGATTSSSSSEWDAAAWPASSSSGWGAVAASLSGSDAAASSSSVWGAETEAKHSWDEPMKKNPTVFGGNITPCTTGWKMPGKAYRSGDVVPSVVGPQPGESFWDYIRRRRNYSEYYIRHLEQPRLKQSRVAREKEAASWRVTKHAEVYCWKEDEETGKLVRSSSRLRARDRRVDVHQAAFGLADVSAGGDVVVAWPITGGMLSASD